MADEKDEYNIEKFFKKLLTHTQPIEPQRTKKITACSNCGKGLQSFKVWKGKWNDIDMKLYEISNSLHDSMNASDMDDKNEILSRVKSNKLYDRNIHGLISAYINKRYCIVLTEQTSAEKNVTIINFATPEIITKVFYLKTYVICMSKNYIYRYNNVRFQDNFRMWPKKFVISEPRHGVTFHTLEHFLEGYKQMKISIKACQIKGDASYF